DGRAPREQGTGNRQRATGNGCLPAWCVVPRRESRPAIPRTAKLEQDRREEDRTREKERDMKLDELKIIVTGAASGMGAHFARRLHESGAKVAAGDVNEALLAELPQGIAKRKLDVSKEDDVASFVQWAHGELGGLNGLVNNAGIIRDGLLVKQDRETK